MADSLARLQEPRNDESVLVDRLVLRQGVSQEHALRLVEDYRKGKRVEIDPALMEGLEGL